MYRGRGRSRYSSPRSNGRGGSSFSERGGFGTVHHEPSIPSEDINMNIDHVTKKSMMPPIPTSVQITGFAMVSSQEELLNFLKRHCRRPFTYSNFTFSPGRLTLLLENKSQAHALAELNGIRFHSEKLNIIVIKDPQSIMQDVAPVATTIPTLTSTNLPVSFKDILKSTLPPLFDSNSLYLNLEAINDLDSFKRTNSRVNFANRSFVSLLFNTVVECFPNLRALNLAKNEIVTLKHFHGCRQWFSEMKNLSLENNRIPKLSELTPLSELNLMEELILKGNTCSPHLIPITSLSSYFKEVSKRFPNLRYLDRVQLSNYPWLASDQSISVDANFIRASFFDKQETQQLISTYLQKFLGFVDNLRESLNHNYSEQSLFSMYTIPVQIPPITPHHKWLTHYITLAMEYIRQNIPLTEPLANLPNPTAQFQGIDAIKSFYMTLPPTQHLLDSIVVDSWQTINGPNAFLNMLIHGSFKESSTGAERWFLRIIILIPSSPQSGAQLGGWPVVIQSDQWIILNPETAPTRLDESQQNAGTPNMAKGSSLPALTPVKQSIVNEFSQSTGLCLPYAVQCLEQNRWVVDDAFKAFRILKSRGKFPADAFNK